MDTNNQIISSIEDTEYPHCGCETLNMTGIPGEEDGKVFHCDAPYMIGGNTVIDEDNSCQLFCDGDLMWHLFCSQGYWSVQIDSAQDIYCYGKDTIMLLVNNKLRLSWVKLKLSLSYSFINFELTFKNFSGGGLEQKM